MHDPDWFIERDDWELYSMVREGGCDSVPAMKEIDCRYRSKIRNYCGLMLRDWHLAEDITQEVFMVLMRPERKPFEKGKEKFSSLLYGIARNKIREYRRKRAKREQGLDEQSIEGVREPSGREMADPFPDFSNEDVEEDRDKWGKVAGDMPDVFVRYLRLKRWARVLPMPPPMRKEAPALGGPPVFQRYLWLRWWSGEGRGCVPESRSGQGQQ